jgi:hypothetical protein
LVLFDLFTIINYIKQNKKYDITEVTYALYISA